MPKASKVYRKIAVSTKRLRRCRTNLKLNRSKSVYFNGLNKQTAPTELKNKFISLCYKQIAPTEQN